MILRDSNTNPLKPLLDWIPDIGVQISNENVERIALYLNSGGVLCETPAEVLETLKFFCSWYGLTEFDIDTNKNLILRKTEYGNQIA